MLVGHEICKEMSIEATTLTVEHLHASYEKHAVLIDVNLTVGARGVGRTSRA